MQVPQSDPQKAVVFDMDGVLFDSEPVHNQAWLDVLAPFGVTYPMEWFAPWSGVSDSRLAQYLADSGIVPCEADSLLRLKRERYRQIAGPRLRVFEGVADGLARLRECGRRIALCTSCTLAEARYSLDAGGVLRYFDELITIDDVARPKPAPDPYVLAARRLGREPRQCYAVEDSESGIQSAWTAGLSVLAVANSCPVGNLNLALRVFPGTAAVIGWLVEGNRTSTLPEARAFR